MMDVELTADLEDGQVFFEEACKFLSHFWWLIDFKWIDIFIKRIIYEVPDDWHEYLNAVDIPALKKLLLNMEADGSCPETFQEFLRKCKAFSIRLRWPQHSTAIPDTERINRTSVKKLRESINFGHFIADFCTGRVNPEEIDKLTVIDVGCGLGYVSSQLHKRGFRVVGIDARPELCETANKRIGDERMSFVHHFITDSIETQQFIEDLVPPGNRGILIALHGCGDLLDHVLNLFSRSEKFVGLFCVTCCYHKICKDKYPRSKCLDESSSKHNLEFDPVNLRAACQKTPLSWTTELTQESLDIHTTSAAFRAMMEEVQVETNYAWKKTKSRMKQTNDVKDYVDQALPGFPEDVRQHALQLLQETIDKRIGSLDRVRTLKILQILIQPVIESVVVFDHVMKLRELGFKSNGVQVFSQIISPRNTAVIAFK